ncbi:hypothetical protein M0R45_033679 [Rubus argutus]|uniref:Titin-like n=1 Tax=Rubus argutus TaxID=59490 RepID=A0AAW1WMI6_RUBAR
MATEADFPEAISVTKGEGEDRYLTSEQFDRNVEQCSPLGLKKSKGELDQHHEIEKPFADSENVKVDCSTQVESKNKSFGISEGEHFLAPLSEISQADQSNQAGMEIVKTEDAKLQVERGEASKNETTVDQHVQAVISNQQDSTKENLQRLENEAEISEVDVKGTEMADGNAESYRNEASGLLEATTFQEYEASISTLDFTNNSLKKDIEMETNVDNTSSTNPIFQEEFKEETSTKVTSNIEDDSQKTMHKYEPEEELQKFPEVMPENAKTESASENAEVITSTDEEGAIQNTKEYSEKEEANPAHGTEKVFEATRTEQVTGEHPLPEIHTTEDHPQEFDEENKNLQACVEAANLSANTEEKNLEEEVIQEKCSSLVEAQTTEKISREEEIHVTDLKEEEKEADAKYEEPIEVADTTREIEFETIAQRTETNKDLFVPIPEEEAYAEESTKAFVQNTTFLSEVSEIKTKEIIQEDLPTVSNYGLVSGEVSHVSGSKEAETEEKEHVEILTDETALETEDHAQAEESFNSKENMEKEIQTAEDEGKRDVKETGIALEEEGLETILTDQTALQTEDVDLQAEENFNSKDILEKQIPTAADEGENGLMEAQAENNEKVTDTDVTTEEKGLATIVTDEGDTGLKEAEEVNKEQVKIADISPEEKVLPTILTDETALDIEDIDVQAEKNSNSKENLEKQIPVVAAESMKDVEEENEEQVKINDNSHEEILTYEAALDNEKIELQAEENFNSKDNSEKHIPTVADEGEICLAKAEAENNEQVTITDITTEEKVLATISTDEKALDTEDIDVQADESFNSEEKLEELVPTTEVRNTEISPEEKDLVTILANETSLDIQDPAVQAEVTSNSKENLEKQISEAPDKGDTCMEEAGEENKEQVKNTDISPEEKGQATIIIDETTQDIEYIDVQAGENFISKEILEMPKAVDEDETDLTESEAENKEHVETTEIGPEEKGLATILTDETAKDIKHNDAQAAEINSKEVLEKQIPTAVDEGEINLTEAEADYKEHVDYTNIAAEQGVETILRDEPALELEDVEQEQENFNSKENLENQIPTAVDEGEAENKEQLQNSDITVLRDETVLDIEDLQAKEYQIPKEESEGEEKVGHGDIVFDHTPVNVYSTELVGDNTVEESFQVQSHEEAEQKLGVKDEKSEDHPERNDIIVEEVLEEPKITSRDFKEEQIIGGDVTIFKPESIEEDTVKNSQDNEKEEIANDLSPEYIPEDRGEKCKDDRNDAVKSEGEILEHSQNVGVEESTTCETKNFERSEEILSTLPVKYDQESSPAPKEALKEENIDEDTFSVEAAKDNDDDNGAITVTETCAKAPTNDEEDSPQVLKYEPEEEITKLPLVLPEETIPESSNENAEVITCTKEEIQESLDKEYDTSTGEACNEAAELSTEGEKEKQTTQEVSSSLRGEETTELSSKEEENFVTSLQKEKNEEHEVCKEAIEAKSETLEDTTEPKPISEEESNKSLVVDNSFLSEASEKEIEKEIQSEYSCTVRNFDSEVVSEETGLSDATVENKEQVETTHIAPEEKDNTGTDVYNTELVGETIVEPSLQVQPLEEEAEPKLAVEDETDKSDDHPEKNNKILEKVPDEPKIINRDFNVEQITEGNVINFATESIAEETVTNYQDDEKETEKLNEEGSSIENITEGNANDISTECVPKDRGEKLEECIGEAVESKEEILLESQTDGSSEITTCDTSGAVKTEEETSLQNEEPREVKVSNLALEKLDSDAPEEETTGGSEVVPESDNKSIDVVTKDELTADQTLDEGIKEPSTFLAEEKEPRACEHEHETTSQDKNIEEEHAKEEEVPTADDTGDLLAPRSVEETCLPKEEPRELNVSELALETLEAGESEEEIKETFETVSKFDSQSIGVVSEAETTTCEIKNVERYEEIVSTSPVKYDQGSSPAPTDASKEENIDENTFSVQEDKDNIDGDNGAVTVTETCAKVTSNDEEDSPQALKYEPGEEITKLPDVLPEETMPESSSENAEVITCTKEEIRESLDKESDTSTGEACNEAAELSTEGEKEQQTTQDVPSSLIGEETTEESSKEEENFVTSLQEEKNEEQEVRKEAIVAKYETLENTAEPKPIPVEESNKSLVEDNSFLSEASEKEIEKEIQSECTCTVTNFDSEVVSDETGLSDATAENKEQVETTHIAPEEKDNAGTGVYNTELVRETIVEPSLQVQPLQEEAEPKLEVEDGTDKLDDHPEKNNKILEEVLDEPKITDKYFNEEQITEGNVVNFATESIAEETVTNYQDDEKETEKLNEEGSSIENIKEGNANDISTECVPEDRGEKIEECMEEAVESNEEILQESQTDGSGEITAGDTTGAEKTEEETSLQNEEPREVKVSNLALEKLDSDATEEETTGGSEVVPEPDSKSIDVVTKDEVIADQTLDEGIKERSTLLAEEKELRASEHELETTSQDKNIEEEHAKEVEVPTADDAEDLLGPRSAEETCLPKEEPRGLNVSELALEKLEAAESEEEIKETFETVSKFDSQSIGVVSEAEILEHTQTTTCEIKNVERYEEIVSTLPVKYDQGSSPAPTEVSKEENIDENTFSVQENKDNIDGDNGDVTVTETCAKITSNDEEDSPQVLKYEPGEEITKLPDVLPEETVPESPSENAVVITCTKEEIRESLVKESDTSTGEVLETTSTETGEHASLEVNHPQGFNDKETTEGNATEYQACNEAAELSTEGEEEKQTTQEVFSSLIGEEKTEESSKEEDNFVTSIQEKKIEEHEVCTEAIEAKSETLENATEPKPISEEESNKSLVEDNSFLYEASEIQGEYSSTVRNFDSEVVSGKIGLTEATAENKEQVETTHIAPEEKDNAGTGVYNTELVRETIVEPSFQVQPLEEEAEPKLEAEDETDISDGPEKNNKILEEVSFWNVSKQVLDKPKITDRDFNEEQITEGNVVNFANESILEETVANYQDDEKETEKLNEGSSIETIKEGNANDMSTVCVPEYRGEKLEECIGEAVESKEEILQESQTEGLGEITTCDTSGVEKTDSDAPEEETTGGSEVVPESYSKSIDVVTKDEIIADQTLDEDISKEPSTLLAEEKELRASEDEHGTTSQDKNIEEKHAKVVEVPTADDTGDLFAPRSVEETCLPKEEPREKVSELALEKREAGESEEKIKETFETVSKFDSQSIGVVSKDEIITDQTQCEGITDAPLQIPSHTLLPEEKDLKTSEVVQETLDADTHEEEIKDGSAMVPKFDSESIDEVLKDDIISETTTVDKNLDEENPKEVEVPADEDKQDLYAATPAKETCLQADEPKDSELALQKLDAGEIEEEIKGTFEKVSISDSQSIVVASGDVILADQTHCEGITNPPLSKDRDFGATELALEKVDAEDTEEIKVPEIVTKFDSESIEIVSNNEVIADQTFNEGITKEQIQSPSSTLLPEEKEQEASEPEHETTAQNKNTEQECTKEVEVSADEATQALFAAGPVEEKSLEKEEPSELNVSELAQEKLHAGDSEEANETFETVSKPDFPSTVAVSSEEITADETLSKGVTDIPREIPSYTSLHEEKELKASELDLEKLDADIPEEEIKEGSEVIPQSNSQSTYEVSKDEIITDQLQIPSSALVPDEKEFKASEHEYETTTDEKNIEDENLKEVEEPTDEATQDLFAARSAVESCLQKEKPSEFKVAELALEKLDADETEEVKETFETVSKSDSESFYAVSKDELTDDQTLRNVITDGSLHIPSYTSLTMENELNASELPLEKLDANTTEEVKEGSEVTPKSDFQSIDVVVKDEIIADQVLHEVKTNDQLQIQSSILLPEEKELKESEHEHGTATQDKNLEEEHAKEIEVAADEDTRDLFVASSEEKTQLQKEEPRDVKVSELAPENLDVGESTDAVSKDESTAEQTLHRSDEQLQIASPTLLPKEKEEATVQKEEAEDCRVPELALKLLNAGEAEEETNEAFETVPEFSSQSIGELATDEIVDQIPPSSLLTAEKRCKNTTTIDNAEEKSTNVVETPNDECRKDKNIAEQRSIPNEEPRELNLSNLEFHFQDTQRDNSNEVHEEEGCSLKEVPKVEPRDDEEEEYVDSNETKKNEASNEERNLEVATSDSRAEDWCETTIEAKIDVPNEEIKDEMEGAKDVGEENIRASQQENESREEKYPEEKNETFNTASSENHHEVTNPTEKDSSVEISQEGILGLEEAYGNTRDIKQLEKESHASNIPSSNEVALNFLQDPTLEDTKPSNDTLVATETKEEKVSESGVETADSTSAQISERLMNESTKERMKVITHLTEEKEPTVSKELQADKEEQEEHENVEEAKTDEEKEDTEHKRTYQGYDEPVIVEASTDTEVKVKKSHNILSGMGSKVKHSISKVKKAIIGKSSNSKTQSEK